MKQARVIQMPVKKKEPEIEAKDKKEDPAYYHGAIKENPLNRKAYDRLMILYRREKNYKKELSIINAAIKAFEKSYSSKKKPINKNIKKVSSQLNKIMGLLDNNGKSIYYPKPISGWQLRKTVVLKKIK